MRVNFDVQVAQASLPVRKHYRYPTGDEIQRTKDHLKMLREAIEILVHRKPLPAELAEGAMETIMSGEAPEGLVTAFLIALRMKGETPFEIAAFARVMRKRSLKVEIGTLDAVDTCGTGGDGANTFNISTAAAFVAAGAGVPLAKHGNRSVSSRCGSSNVLEALGVHLLTDPGLMARCLEETGITFLYAPALHPAMKHAARPRQLLGMRTVFNLLGPLTNPAGVKRQVLGVFAPEWTKVLAEVLRDLGSRKVLVVHGHGGLDELSLSGPSQISFMENGAVVTEMLEPEEFGLARRELSDLAGGGPEENAGIIRKVLRGEAGARRDVVLLNAAASLLVAEVADNWKEVIAMAEKSLDTGAALDRLEALISFTQRHREEQL